MKKNHSLSFLPWLMLLYSAPTLLTHAEPAMNSISKPVLFAHRAGSGLWPQNSRHAVTQFLETIAPASNAGLELDIVLTKDMSPVLAHDPWIHKTLCTTVAGES